MPLEEYVASVVAFAEDPSDDTSEALVWRRRSTSTPPVTSSATGYAAGEPVHRCRSRGPSLPDPAPTLAAPTDYSRWPSFRASRHYGR